MEGYQLIYSACKTGIHGRGNGFQIYSYTQGIPGEYISNEGIGKICRYKVPADLPSAPRQEEIEALFPVSYTYGKLRGKESFLSRGKYVGLDNTGHRYGNFISHGIAFSDLEHYPADGFCWEGFLDDLPESEKNRETAPDYLAAVSLEKVFAGVSFSAEKIGEFLWEDPDRGFYLKRMIRGVFDYFTTGKRILVCDEKENLPFWIAAVTHGFPLYLAKEITFTTYAFDPVETDWILCGTAGSGTAYSVETARNYGIFQIFDFKNNYFSEGNGEGSYEKAAEAGYTVSPAIPEDLFEYMENFGYTFSMGYSPCLYDSYQLCRGNGRKLAFTEVRDALRYVCERGKESFAKDFFGTVCKYFEEEREITGDLLYCYVKYTMLLAERLQDGDLCASVSVLYWRKVLELVKQSKGRNRENLENLHRNVLAVSAGCRDAISASLPDPEVAGWVAASLREEPEDEDSGAYAPVFWMRHILSYISGRKLTLRQFAQERDAEMLKAVYCRLQTLRDPAAAVRELTGKDLSGNDLPAALLYELYDSFFGIFDRGETGLLLREDLYKRLLEAGDRPLLKRYMLSMEGEDFYELKTRMLFRLVSISGDTDRIFYALISEIKVSQPLYWSRYAEKLLGGYCALLEKADISGKERNDFRRKAVLFAVNEIRNRDYIEKIIPEFDKTVSLQSKRDPYLLEAYLSALKEEGYDYKNTKAYTVWVLQDRVFPSGFGKKADMDSLCRCNLSLLEKGEKEYTVQSAFEIWGSRLVKREEHVRLLNALSSMGRELWTYYSAFVIDQAEKNPRVFASYFEFISQEPDKAEEAYDAVLELLASLPGRQGAKLCASAEPCIRKSLRKEYQELTDRAEEKRKGKKPGIFGRLKMIFPGKDGT